jgi:tetrahydromethanopterin S-methyltransferase subunit B
MMKAILSLLLIFSFSFANAQNVKAVDKGFVVEEKGFFVTREQMEKFVELDKENKLLKQKVVTLEQLSANYLEQIDYHKNRANRLQADLDWSETKGYFKTAGGFIVGTILTGLISYGAFKAAN